MCAKASMQRRTSMESRLAFPLYVSSRDGWLLLARLVQQEPLPTEPSLQSPAMFVLKKYAVCCDAGVLRGGGLVYLCIVARFP